MKIYYWSPFLTNIATIKSVLRSAESLVSFKNPNSKHYEVSILNSSGEWDFIKKKKFKVKIEKLYPFSFYKVLPKEGFLSSRFSFIVILIINFFPLIFKIKNDKPKYLIVHLLTLLPIILSPILSKNTRIILRISGLPELTFLRKFIWKLFSKYIFKVTVPTSTTYNLIKNSKIFDKKKIFLLRDPAIDEKEIFINKNIGLPKKFCKKKFLVSIGRLTKQKNFSFLIKMFTECKRLMGIDYLIILGEGEERPKLQKIINKLKYKNEIFLLGYKKNVYNFINKSEALISTAEYEDPGFSLIEAAFLKKKIITSLVNNGPKEMKRSGNFCYFFNFDDSSSFLSTLKKTKSKNKKKIKLAYYYSLKFLISNHYKNLIKILT